MAARNLGRNQRLGVFGSIATYEALASVDGVSRSNPQASKNATRNDQMRAVSEK